jgi:hypothetical protein
MRKIVAFLAVFLGLVWSVMGQTILLDLGIKECILSLGKSPPEYFNRVDRVFFISDWNSATLLLETKDDIVIESSIGYAFNTTNEAYSFLTQFYNYLDEQGWEYSKKNNLNTYEKDDIIVLFIPPTKRIDNLIFSGIFFRKKIPL